MKRWLMQLLVFLAPGAAMATPFTTDWTDVWYNPSESGWGATTYQQADTIFLAIYVYGPSGTPTWYFSSGMTFSGTSGGSQVFTGALSEARGTYFPSPWVPASASTRQVGTVTLTFNTIQTATVAYTVDGTPVSKAMQRYAFKVNSMAGSYIGAGVGTYSSQCGSFAGYSEEPAGFTVTHGATGTVTIVAQYANLNCTYTGGYGQGGRFGFMNGTFSCSNGGSGAFAAFEIDSGISALSARATVNFSSPSGCTWSGRIGGIRRG